MNLTYYENIVSKETAKNHKLENELLEKLLNIYATGFGLIGKFSSKDNEANFMWILLLSHSFQSLRSSFELMQKGYYRQSMALIRMVTEDYFICGNAPKNNNNVIGVILRNEPIITTDKKGKTHKRDSFDYHDLADKMNALDIHKKDYKYECKFTHLTSLSAGTIAKPIDGKYRLIKPMPIYEKLLFLNCCERLFKNGTYMLELMALLVNESHKEKSDLWLTELSNTNQEIIKWFDNLKKSYGGHQP